MTAIIYTSITEHRGAARLWIEGTRLTKEGIEPQTRYDLHYDTRNHRLILTFKDDGWRIVSKRTRKGRVQPVIDINNQDLKKLFGSTLAAVRIIIKKGGMVVSLHHHAEKIRERFDRLVSKLTNGEPLNSISLSHGGGILDHALHQGFHGEDVPIRLAAAVEIEGKYLDCSQENNPIWDDQSIAIEAPMEDVEFDRLKYCEILVAGLPCTGASLAGRTKNKLKNAEEHCTAGALFLTFIDAIKALQPAVVLLENVKLFQTSTSMTVIRSALAHLGYEIEERIFNGVEFGALENRDRLVMIAVSKGLEFTIDNISPTLEKIKSINEVLEVIEDDSPRWKTFSYLDEKEKRDIKAGKGFRRQLLTGVETSCGVIGRGYSKVRSTEPHLVHPENGLNRLFTPNEHAAVKTIPASLVDGVSEKIAHEILGQSVIHTIFKAIGGGLAKTLSALRPPVKLAANGRA